MSTPRRLQSWPSRRSATPQPVTATALWKAAKKHDAAEVRRLILQHNDTAGSLAIVNEFHPKKSTNPLMIACKKRDKSFKNRARNAAETVQILIDFGAETDTRSADPDGNTALHFAAMSNQVRSVEFLLHAGANAFAVNRHGFSPIDLARWHESRDVVDVLTQNARIHSGWVYCKTLADPLAAIQVRLWKKRFAVLLSCDNTRSMLELSLFKDVDDIRPSRVILLRAGTHDFGTRAKENWQDKHNMFHANRPLVVQKMSSKNHFSRAERWLIAQEEKDATERVRFATDSADQRDRWVSMLNDSFGVVIPPPERRQSSGRGRPSVVQPAVEPDFTAHDSVLWSSGDIPVASAPSFSAERPPSFIAQPPTERAAEIEAEAQSGSEQDESPPSFIAEPPTERAQSGSEQDESGRGECLICMDAKRDAICVPCGHVAGCHLCLVRHVASVKKCPICRAAVQTIIKIYDC